MRNGYYYYYCNQWACELLRKNYFRKVANVKRANEWFYLIWLMFDAWNSRKLIRSNMCSLRGFLNLILTKLSYMGFWLTANWSFMYVQCTCVHKWIHWIRHILPCETQWNAHKLVFIIIAADTISNFIEINIVGYTKFIICIGKICCKRLDNRCINPFDKSPIRTLLRITV